MSEGRKSWRDGNGIALLELILFAAVFVGGTYNYLPVSHTLYLFFLGWAMLKLRSSGLAEVGLLARTGAFRHRIGRTRQRCPCTQ